MIVEGHPAPERAPYRDSEAQPTYLLAGWWSRVAAAVVDWLVVTIPGPVLGLLVGLAVGGTTGLAVGAVLGVLILMLLGLLYPSLILWRTDGRSVGRRLLGIRVVRETGAPFDAGAAFTRELAVKGLLVGAASGATGGLGGLANALWPLWDDERRALHDMVARTRVVRDGALGGVPPATSQLGLPID